MNTCGTCKHRGDVIKKENFETFECNSTTFFLCNRIKHDHRYQYAIQELAVVIDGSGYHAALCVENDFGCNLWEVK